MNENVNLSKILRDCLKGTKLYSTIYGDVELVGVYLKDDAYPIEIKIGPGSDMICDLTNDGRLLGDFPGECTLFPSKEQRDWSKFKPLKPKLNVKKPKFDPKTLKPFDKVLVKYLEDDYWTCDLFSNITKEGESHPCLCISGVYDYCIPYNDDTKHLLAMNEEVPEFYRYWED